MDQDHHLQYLSPSPSDLDSQSDSDWLDIVSSRESDDNDSVPSDREDIHSVPLSRRSSVSFGSSREGDVEAWEGFVDESDDDKSSPIRPGMYPNPPAVSIAQLDALGSNLDAAGVHDTAEDERVKEGLEQSLISTLSSSRSSSAYSGGSTHASLRDLRLSFPDPLTSSKDNLPLSRPSTPPVNEVTPSSAKPQDTTAATVTKPEPELVTAIPQPECSQASKYDIDIDIILYGSSPSSKWPLLEQLLRKAAGFTRRSLTTVSCEDSAHFVFKPRSEAVQPNGIAVYDCTQGGAIHFTSSNPDRPSLAVVFLPSDSSHALPQHTLYLPIFLDIDSTDVVASNTSVRSSAERAWRRFSVPPGKTLRLGNVPTSILLSSELENVDSFRVHRALQRLFLPVKKQPSKTFADHLSSVPAVTFFALVSIIMSFAINTMFRPEPTPVFGTPTASPTWGMTTTQLNSSTAAQPTSVSQQGTALIASSLKDFALSLINPHNTALSVTSQSSSLIQVSQPLTSKIRSRREAQLPAHASKFSPSTEVILRPVPTPTSIFTEPTKLPSMTSKEERVVPSGSAANIKLIDSVPEVFETTVKAALDAVHNDLKELVDAMDDLMRAIQDQTKKVMSKSADTALSIQDHVNYRNGRARGKAREIREKSEKFIQSAGEQLMETTWSMKIRGEQFVMFAQEHIKDRTAVAKEKAHGFRERIINSETWQTYVAGNEEWAKRVIDERAKREYKKWIKPKRKCGKESCMSDLMWG